MSLRAHRELRGLSLRAAAEFAGVSEETLRAWETGARPIDARAEEYVESLPPLRIAMIGAADGEIIEVLNRAPGRIELVQDGADLAYVGLGASLEAEQRALSAGRCTASTARLLAMLAID